MTSLKTLEFEKCLKTAALTCPNKSTVLCQESMQGSSDETANSVEEGSSSGRSEASSNEAASSRASQSAASPGSDIQSDDMNDSEALKEEEDEEDEEEVRLNHARSQVPEHCNSQNDSNTSLKLYSDTNNSYIHDKIIEKVQFFRRNL